MSTAWESLRRRTAAVPRPVWAATLLFSVILGAWSTIMPLYEAPDEPGHADLVFHLARGESYPAYDDRGLSEAVLTRCSTFVIVKHWCPPAGEYSVTPDGHIKLDFPATDRNLRIAGDARDRSTAPGFEAAGGDRQTAFRNQIAQHPPLYYELAGGMVRLERKVLPGSLSLDQEMLLVRLMSGAMVMWLPLLSWLAARRAGLGSTVSVTAAFVPLAIPQLAHIGSVVNNDNLLTLLGAGLIVALAGVARGDRSVRTAVVTSVLLAAALLSKTSAVVFVPTVVAAYVLGAWRSRPVGDGRPWRDHLMQWGGRLVGVGGGVAVLAGWWYVGNRIAHGTFTPSIDDDKLAARKLPEGFVPSFDEWWTRAWDVMPGRFWGSPGWFSVKIDRTIAVRASTVVLVAAIVALLAASVLIRRWAWGRRLDDDHLQAPGVRTGPVDLLLLLTPFIITGAFVLGRSWKLYGMAGTIPFLQGRYFFPSIVGLAVVVAVGTSALLRRAAPIVVLGAAAYLHVKVMLGVMAAYWGPPGSDLRTQIYAAVAWCPFPTIWWWTLLVVGPLIAAVTVWSLVAWVRDGLKTDRCRLAESVAQ